MVEVTGEPLSEDRARFTIGLDFTGHGIGRLLVPLVSTTGWIHWESPNRDSGRPLSSRSVRFAGRQAFDDAELEALVLLDAHAGVLDDGDGSAQEVLATEGNGGHFQ